MSGDLRFPLEPGEAVCVGYEGAGVTSLIHLAHTPLTDLCSDGVGAEGGAGLEGH